MSIHKLAIQPANHIHRLRLVLGGKAIRKVGTNGVAPYLRCGEIEGAILAGYLPAVKKPRYAPLAAGSKNDCAASAQTNRSGWGRKDGCRLGLELDPPN